MDFFYYFGANILFSLIYIVFSIMRIVRFNYRFNLKKQATEIPAFVYYPGVVLCMLFRIVFFIVFLPAYIFLILPYNKKIKNGKKANTQSCFSQCSPYISNNMTGTISASVGKNRILKKRFHCEFWDSYNSGSECRVPYDCVKFCPTFSEYKSLFLYTDAQEAEYENNKPVDQDFIDLSKYSH